MSYCGLTPLFIHTAQSFHLCNIERQWRWLRGRADVDLAYFVETLTQGKFRSFLHGPP